MSGQQEKSLRTISSRKFTRCYNRLNEAILNKLDEEIIITKFNDLKVLWEDVQSKHDNYLIAKYPEEDEEFNKGEDAWLNKIEERFEIATKSKFDYLKLLKDARKSTSDLKVKEELSVHQEESLRSALTQRNSLHFIFKQEIKNIQANIGRDTSGILKTQIMSDLKDLKPHLDKCQEAHLGYISHKPGLEVGEENEWIENIQASYDVCSQEVLEYLQNVSIIEAKRKQRLVTKMESIKMPTFKGNIRDYAKFKADFKAQVENKLDPPETLTYVLRSCLEDKALYLVEIIENATEIWWRLDERFGKPSILIDVIMDEIKSIGLLRDGNSTEFIKFVVIVEKGYIDLHRLKLER